MLRTNPQSATARLRRFYCLRWRSCLPVRASANFTVLHNFTGGADGEILYAGWRLTRAEAFMEPQHRRQQRGRAVRCSR